MNTKDIYRNSSGIDIDEQRRIWDERGKGYYGEYLVFDDMFLGVPGQGKMLVNLEIPTGTGRTTEIDMLYIHETGFYVFEVKHYKGTIYGKTNDEKWTQYFRTAPNSHFYNPIRQNNWHIQALKKSYPVAPMYSFVVFTNDSCDLRVQNDDPNVTVCKLHELDMLFLEQIRNRGTVLSPERIDELFMTLLPYSPSMRQIVNKREEEPVQTAPSITPAPAPTVSVKPETPKEEPVTIEEPISKKTYDYEGAEPLPFYMFSDQLRQSTELTIKEVKATYKHKSNAITALCVAVLVCAFAVSYYCFTYYRAKADNLIKTYQTQYESMARNFEHVEPYNGGEITAVEDLVTVEDVVVENSTEIEDAAIVRARLIPHGEKYGLWFLPETKVIVQLKDGTVKEYDLFSEKLNYSSLYKLLPSHWEALTVPNRNLYEVKAEDIAYIKLSGLALFEDPCFSVDQTIRTDMEIELYSAE